MLDALLKKLRFAFTGRPEEMRRRRRRGVSLVTIGDAGQPKNIDWQGAGCGAPGPRNGYGTKPGPGF